ncbi:hypothetical protein B0H21DRAFT_862301 [Amylocystis lapponica]|nr:hypothetical protein B0H21DRAFT_862301 [Amylocystis lapponica]
MGLEGIPVELLYEIQIHALSSSLPLTSRHLHAVFKSASPSFHAQYIVRSYLNRSTTSDRALGCVSVALRYPICDQAVVDAILRGYSRITSKPVQLPRRLFRSLAPRSGLQSSSSGNQGASSGDSGWTADDAPMSFLRYLCDHPLLSGVDPDSHDGYALTKAVYAGFIPLVRLLLKEGASPALKQGMALKVAIRRKDLALVRMLIEPDASVEIRREEKGKTGVGRSVMERPRRVGEKRKAGTDGGGGRSTKRRRLQDRVKVSQEMLKVAVQCDARDIVEYFTKEKGCIPDIKTLILMSR